MADPRPYSKKELKSLFTNLKRKGVTDSMMNILIETLWRNKFTMRTSGFANAGGPDAVISFDDSKRLFTIKPLDPEVESYVPRFAFYTYNYSAEYHQRFDIENLELPDLEGLYCIYFDTGETNRVHQLFYAHNPSELQLMDIYYTKVIVAFVYWDAASKTALHFGDSRHGSEWNPQMHLYLHTAFSARRKNGLTLTGTSFGGDGSEDAHAKFSVTGGTMLHDDFEMDFESSSESLPIMYRHGALPRFHNNAGYAIYTLSGLACYNNGAGAVVPATEGYHVLYHIFATNEIGDPERKIISVMGSNEYGTLAEAYAAAEGELDYARSWMPQQGRLHIATIVVQTSDAYTNAIHSRIVGVWGEPHPPVTIAENSQHLLEIDEKQELSIIEAPADGKTYGRKNKTWAEVVAGSGDDGRGIVSILLTNTVGLVKTYTITYTDATTSTFEVVDGEDGAPGTPGRGIASIALHATNGKVKTYRITYTDATTFDFDVADGEDGDSGSGSTAPELHLDFEEAGDEFVYNVPYNMKFTSMVCEGTDATLDVALNTTMARYDRLTITATAAGLVSIYGEYV